MAPRQPAIRRSLIERKVFNPSSGTSQSGCITMGTDTLSVDLLISPSSATMPALHEDEKSRRSDDCDFSKTLGPWLGWSKCSL